MLHPPCQHVGCDLAVIRTVFSLDTLLARFSARRWFSWSSISSGAPGISHERFYGDLQTRVLTWWHSATLWRRCAAQCEVTRATLAKFIQELATMRGFAKLCQVRFIYLLKMPTNEAMFTFPISFSPVCHGFVLLTRILHVRIPNEYPKMAHTRHSDRWTDYIPPPPPPHIRED